MKKLIIALALLISPTVLQAEETLQSDNICPEMGSLAQTIMSARQEGIPMSDVLQALKGDKPTATQTTRSLVIMAYEEIQWSSEDRRVDAANRFRNKIELACYKNE